jgi:hypothetical protein
MALNDAVIVPMRSPLDMPQEMPFELAHWTVPVVWILVPALSAKTPVALRVGACPDMVRYQRSLSIPEEIIGSKVTAKMSNGILTVELPKKIPIKVEEPILVKVE